MKPRGYYQKIKSIIGLSLSLAKADFKLKNEGSYIGIFWYLLNPILMFSLLYLIFSTRLGNNIHYYGLYLFLGIIMFNFFQASTLESTKSIIKENVWIIKSINFPREALILSICLTSLFSHFFEILLFFIILLFFKISLIGILYYFLVLIFFFIFIFGISLMLASLTVYFVDLGNIWNFGIRILWFITPIFYEIAGQTKLFYLNLLNPLYYFMTIARELIIYNKMPPLWIFFGAVGYSLISLIIGLSIFNKLKVKFAEMI
jgi:lipopolysaccharide transport system permease protein